MIGLTTGSRTIKGFWSESSRLVQAFALAEA
jgi:hypothetical protein